MSHQARSGLYLQQVEVLVGAPGRRVYAESELRAGQPRRNTLQSTVQDRPPACGIRAPYRKAPQEYSAEHVLSHSLQRLHPQSRCRVFCVRAFCFSTRFLLLTEHSQEAERIPMWLESLVTVCEAVGVQESPHKPYKHGSQFNRDGLFNAHSKTDGPGEQLRLKSSRLCIGHFSRPAYKG